MQKIEIKNFGPIVRADIQVNDFTVLIGEHAMGKSTIAMLIYFFRSLKEDLVVLGRQSTIELTDAKIINSIRDKFYLYFGSTARLNPNYSIKYSFDDKMQIILRGSPLKPEFISLSWFQDIAKEIRNASNFINRYRRNLNFDSAQREEERLRLALSGIFKDYTTPLFIPDGRNITVKFQDSILKLFSEALILPTAPSVDEQGNVRRNDAQKIGRYLMRDFILWVEKNLKQPQIFMNLREIPDGRVLLERIEHRLLKAKYRFSSSSGEHLVLHNNSKIELDNASSGQQESIRIAQDISYCILERSPVFRVIEEPEAHLFPTGQQAIIELLVAMLNSTSSPHEESSVLITTHSPYLLTILNNLILAGDLESEGRNLESISKDIPRIFRLKPNQVSAYMMNSEGICSPINDTAQGESNPTGLIGSNLLEDAFGNLQNQFDELLDLGG